jgi:hypothetical protein
VTVTVQLLADVPELIEPVGRLRFAEWGDDGDVDRWVSATRSEAGREELPVTWVAIDESGGSSPDHRRSGTTNAVDGSELRNSPAERCWANRCIRRPKPPGWTRIR